MAVAVFDYSAWSARYPELSGAVDANRAALLFAEAGLYLDNTDCSPVQDAKTRLVLLNMLVAHIAVLGGALEPGGVPSGMVGRITSATEGSVSISVDSGLMAGTAAWYQQTGYGLSFWQAAKRFTRASYVPAAPMITDPWRQPWRRY